MKISPATTLAAVGLLAAGGFIAGRMSAPAGNQSGTSAGEAHVAPRTTSQHTSQLEPAGTAARPRPAARGEAPAGAARAPQPGELERIVRGDNALDRTRALLAFIDKLDPAELGKVVDEFRELGLTRERMGDYSLLLTAWAQADPLGALAYAKENTGGNFATETILTTWAASDPEAAIRWARDNHQGEDANPYMASLIGVIGRTDLPRATQLVGEMPFSRERGEALASIMPGVLAQGPAAAKQWAMAIQDEQLREGAIARVAEELASTDPQGTAAWLSANPSPGTERAMGSAMASWARQDANAATSYFNSLPAGPVRSSALRGLVSAVASENPQAGAAMLNRYSGDVTDSVVRHFIWSSFRNDPATAASNIARINDSEQRDEMYRRMLGGWLRRDPDNAQAWIRSNTQLPDNIRQDLNREIR